MSFDIEKIRSLLEKAIQPLPDNFYDTFDFTVTGNNFTHPVTLSILHTLLVSLNSSYKMGIDVRLNLGNNNKFQPDFVVFGADIKNAEIKLYLDYEGPNSSDARITEKDVPKYLTEVLHF